MRYALLLLVAACGFSKPRDRCDGPCALYAIDRPIARTGDVLTLEGTFEDGALVDFPGGVRGDLEYRGSHRAIVRVPDGATAGELAVSMPDGYTDTVPFRRVPFDLTVGPFRRQYEQTDVGRYTLAPSVRLTGATTVLAGQYLYLIGGIEGDGATDRVRVAHAGLDGTLDDFRDINNPLQAMRGFHSSVVVGHFLYVIGGLGLGGSLDTVERAEIAHDGTLGAFSIVPGVKLVQARDSHATVIMGDHIFVIGGRAGGTDLATIERARITGEGQLSTFETISEIPLPEARSGLTAQMVGNLLYVVGGAHANVPGENVWSSEVSPDGYLGDFVEAGKLATPRSGHVTAYVNGALYVIGGTGPTGDLDTIESAVLSADNMPVPNPVFTPIASVKLAEPRTAATAITVGNYVFLLGGAYTASQLVHGTTWIERASIVDQGVIDQFTPVTETKLVQGRMSFCSVVIGNRLYVIGGGTGVTAALRTVEHAAIAADGTLGPFEADATMLGTPRIGAAAYVSENYVYVSGGNDGTKNLDTVERAFIGDDGTLGPFEPTLGFVQPSYARYTHAAFMSGYSDSAWIELVGGIDANGYTASVLRTMYRVATSSFDDAQTPLPSARGGIEMVVLDHYAYALSGRNASLGENNLCANLPDKAPPDAFTAYNAAFTPRDQFAAVVSGPTVYLIGGTLNSTTTAGIESAKIGSDHALSAFQPFNLDLRTQRFGHQAVALGNYIYVFGGATAGTIVTDAVERTLVK